MGKYTLCAFALAALTLASCGSKKGKGESSCEGLNPGLKFESYSFDRIAETNSTDTLPAEGWQYWNYEGEGVLPTANEDKNVTALRDSLIRLVGITFDEDGNPEPVIPSDQTLTNMNPLDTDACNEVNTTLTASLVSPRVTVFEYNGESYACLAAHGIGQRSYVNYAMDDGKILGLADLFVEGYEKGLATLIQRNLQSKKVSLLVALKDVEVSGTFSISRSGVVFTYNPYEIAAFSDGIIEVEVNTADLQKARLLTPYGYRMLTGQEPPK